MEKTKKEPRFEVMFMGLNSENAVPHYPHWMHKEHEKPVLVKDEIEENAAREKGYDNISAAALSNRYLINWFWDLEDMSAKQLHVFAQEEYGVDLPIEAGQQKLFELVCELTRHAPQNQSRLVLMAHTIKMNYDETLEEIKRMMIPGINGVASEVETFEVWA